MISEIVFEELPSGFELAKQMVRLRCFIEHRLVTMKKNESDWVLDQDDPTWQALCNYYGLVIQICMPTLPALSLLQPCVASISSGAVLLGFDYPFSWDMWTLNELLDPYSVFQLICDSIYYNGKPSGGGDSPIPLTCLDRHLANTKPAKVLSLSLNAIFDEDFNDVNVITLDDGQFMSGIVPPSQMPEWSSPHHLSYLKKRVWKRWVRDSVIGIGLRDVVSPDGQIVLPTSEMTNMLESYCRTSEHDYLVLSAIANGLWDSKLAHTVITRLLTAEANRPKSFDAFLKALPQAVVDIVIPPLTAYRL